VTDTAYLNGQWLPLAEARVPVLDRGFLFADGVYEVIPAYGGACFALDGHLRRLARSLRELRIADPLDEPGWRGVVERLVRENGGGDLAVYLQVTRGAPAKRSHVFPDNTPPTVLGLCHALPSPSAHDRAQGVGALTRPDIRWHRCDIKAIALLPNLLATQAAKEQGCNEAILHRDGRVTEGASSNVWVVHGGKVATPPQGPDILSGVTRDVLLGLLRGAGVTVEERAVRLEELARADEIWLTSSTREVLAVTRLDGAVVGAGTPGPLWHRAFALFQDAKRRGS